MVVNLGLQSNIKDWFQVGCCISNVVTFAIIALVQMIGRAGRDGHKSTAAIVFHPKELRNKTKDIHINSILGGGCIRRGLLTALDFEEIPIHESSLCCTGCTVETVDPNGYIVPQQTHHTCLARHSRKHKWQNVSNS